jgi:putative hydrolase of the HAD superfamily
MDAKEKEGKGEEGESKIKAILWDNAGVLGDAKCGSFVQLWMERLGSPLDDVIRVLTGPEHDLLDLGEIETEVFFDYVIRELGLPPEKKTALNSVSWDDMTGDMELFAYIRDLHKRYKTAILSNFPTYLLEMERAAVPWLDEIFDEQIFSCEVHLLKPDPRIYHLALERIGCAAQEAVFIDDSPANVVGAHRVGMQAILYKNREHTIQELERLLDME